MINTLQHKDCPLVLDSLSAPMLGEQKRIVMLSMKLRNSHFREVPNMSYDEKIAVMINPKV